MHQIVEQTCEEKFKMYQDLSKKELITMLIEANKHLNNRPYQICSCNHKNGNSWVNYGLIKK